MRFIVVVLLSLAIALTLAVTPFGVWKSEIILPETDSQGIIALHECQHHLAEQRVLRRTPIVLSSTIQLDSCRQSDADRELIDQLVRDIQKLLQEREKLEKLLVLRQQDAVSVSDRQKAADLEVRELKSHNQGLQNEIKLLKLQRGGM